VKPAIIRTSAELRTRVDAFAKAGEQIGVVPTMGSLHAGHLSLIEAATTATDRVIVTIFVNPRQFNNPDDLRIYPRDEAADIAALTPFEVDLIYAPDPVEIYPPGFATTISVAGISEGLCGAHRPGHFDGVSTVVAKLLVQTGADRAFFGEKDFQQLAVVRRMVVDLDIGCEIIGCPTVRAENGLALSSRNALLDDDARLRAGAIHRALMQASRNIRASMPLDEALGLAETTILAAGFQQVEYLELRDLVDFKRQTRLAGPARLLVAAHISGVRLIDNIAVDPDEPNGPLRPA